MLLNRGSVRLVCRLHQALSISMMMMGVSDLDVSIAFYLDKLSFSIANRSQEFGFSSAAP